MIYIGLDDTDTLTSRGTGHLARVIADELSSHYPVAGVTRHQLLFDSRIPYTAKNSCAAIILELEDADLDQIFVQVRAIMMAHFEPGSDPGLAVAKEIPTEVVAFGHRAKTEVIHQSEAFELAGNGHPIHLECLGGSCDGVIGALAAIGLASDGNDGRYINVGSVRDLTGMVPPQQVISAGVTAVRQLNGDAVTGGMLDAERLRPARRERQPILYVEQGEDGWMPLKLD
jgi:tRNA(Ile2) C34 agmatinyltransferase TiaS